MSITVTKEFECQLEAEVFMQGWQRAMDLHMLFKHISYLIYDDISSDEKIEELKILFRNPNEIDKEDN